MSAETASVRSQRIVNAGIAAAVAAALSLVVLHVLHVWILDGVAAIDARNDASIFEWLARVAIAVCVGVVLLIAVRDGYRLQTLALATLLAVVLVDDTLGVHRELGAAWDLAYLGLLLVTAVLLARLAPAGSAAGNAIRLGLIVLVASLLLHAVAARAVSRIGAGPGELAYESKVLLKEASELGGWMFVAAGLIAIVGSAGPRSRGTTASGPPLS